MHALALLLVLTAPYLDKTYTGRIRHGETYGQHVTRFYYEDQKIVGEYEIKNTDTPCKGRLSYVKDDGDEVVFKWMDCFGTGTMRAKFQGKKMTAKWSNDDKEPWHEWIGNTK